VQDSPAGAQHQQASAISARPPTGIVLEFKGRSDGPHTPSTPNASERP